MPAQYINWTSPIDHIRRRSEISVVIELLCWTGLELLFIKAFICRLGQRRERNMLLHIPKCDNPKVDGASKLNRVCGT